MFKSRNAISPVFSNAGTVILDNNIDQNIILNGKLSDALKGKWILRNNSNAELTIEAASSLISINNPEPESVIYLRTISELDYDVNSTIICKVTAITNSKQPLTLTITLFKDKELQHELNSIQVKAEVNDINHEMACEIEASYSGLTYVLFQVNFPPNELEVTFDNIKASIQPHDEKFNPIRFGMRSFGPYEKASARLRCWKVAEVLKRAGHSVSVNSNASSDVLYYQKVKDIKHFKGISNKESRLFVFDFDDNYFLPNKGSPAELLSFMNQMDVVTVGSHYLYDIAKDYHPNLVVLENPADIIHDTVVKSLFNWHNNVGWFGAPENVLQLKLVDFSGKVTTITRGGDIEFDIYSVDKQLTDFDLLLFPLEITEWNAAKNANRMIKAVCLGIPVLASATPEHIRVAKQFNLSDDFLVFDGDSWQEKIQKLQNNYSQVETEITLARKKALNIYSVDSITKTFFNEIMSFGKRDTVKNKFLSDKFKNTALVNVSFSIIGQNFERFLENTEIDFNSFSSVKVYADFINQNKLIEHKNTVDFTLDINPLNIYQQLENFIENTKDEYILIAESNVSLLKPLIKHITFDQDVLGIDLTIHEGVLQDFPKNNLEAYKTLLDKKYPKALLVKTSWLRSKQIKASEMLSYFSMAIWFEALVCNESNVAFTELPLGILYKEVAPVNISNVFYRNILRNEPEFKTEIPNIENQWVRTSHDVVQTMLSRQPQAAASVGAKILQIHYAHMATGKK
jgi:hypothetical protein